MATSADDGDLLEAGSARAGGTAWPRPSTGPGGFPVATGAGRPAAEAETARSAAMRPARRGAPLPIAATVAALWAAIVSWAPLLLFALLATAGAGGPGGAGAVTRLATSAWLLGQGVPVPVGAEPVSLTPLLLTALAAWRLTRAGVHASRVVSGQRARRLSRALAAGVAVGLAYGLLGAVAALATRPGGASPGRAVVTLALFGGAAATLGALGHSRAGRALVWRAPAVLRDAARTGVAAAALVLACGAAAAGAALAVRGGDAAAMLGQYRVGVLGQTGITLVCLVYLPTVAVWGAAYLLGPGFAVGVGTVVSPGLVAVGPVPSVPLFAGLPVSASSGVASAVLGVPLAAAMITGFLLARRRAGTRGAELLAVAALAGPAGGGLLQLAAVAATGALGSGRLAVLGPTGWGVGLWGTVVIAAGALVGAATARTLRRGAAGGDRVGPYRRG